MAAPESDRLPALDLLRGLAALAVMLPHFAMYSTSNASPVAEIAATMAVEIFFVLSGFVLGSQIRLCAQQKNWITLKTFLVRRWMRTIPSYLVALIAISLTVGSIGTADFFRYAFYIQNLSSQHNAHDYYPVAWSLSVEEWYYVSFPIIVLLVGKIVRVADVWLSCLVAVLLFVILVGICRLTYGNVPDWGAFVRRVVAFRVDAIAYGFLLYLILQRATGIESNLSRALSLILLSGTAITLIYLNTHIFLNGKAWLQTFYPFASAAFGMAVVLFFVSINSFVGWMSAVCEFLGRISYPMYLLHLVVLYFLARFGIASGLPGLLIYSFAVIACSALFHFGFEQPILACRPHYKKHLSVSETVVEMAAT